MNGDRVKLGNCTVPSVLVRDMRETLEFYTGVLGFTQSGKYPAQGTPSWAEVRRDGVVLQFYAEPPVGMEKAPVFSGTLYFYPEDVRALAQELEGKVTFAWGPEVMDYGQREFAVQDPNGYYLAFAEPAD